MNKKLVLALSALLLLTGMLWQKGSVLVTSLINRQRLYIPPISPVVRVSGTDPHADALTLIQSAENLYRRAEQKAKEEQEAQIKQTALPEAQPSPILISRIVSSSLPSSAGSGTSVPVSLAADVLTPWEIMDLARVKALAGERAGAQRSLQELRTRLLKEYQAKSRLLPSSTDYLVGTLFVSLAGTQTDIGDRAGAQKTVEIGRNLKRMATKSNELNAPKPMSLQFNASLYRTPEEAVAVLRQLPISFRMSAAQAFRQKYPDFQPIAAVIREDLNPTESWNPSAGAKLTEGERLARIRAARTVLTELAIRRGDFADAQAQVKALPDLALSTTILQTAMRTPRSPNREQFIDEFTAQMEQKILNIENTRWSVGSTDYVSVRLSAAAAHLLRGRNAEAKRLLQAAVDFSNTRNNDNPALRQYQTNLMFLQLLQTLPKDEIAEKDFTFYIDNAWRMADRVRLNDSPGSKGQLYWDLATVASQLHEPAKARDLIRRAKWELWQWEQENLDDTGKPFKSENSFAHLGSLWGVWSQIAVAQAHSGDTRGAVLTLSRIQDKVFCARTMLSVAEAILTRGKGEKAQLSF